VNTPTSASTTPTATLPSGQDVQQLLSLRANIPSSIVNPTALPEVSQAILDDRICEVVKSTVQQSIQPIAREIFELLRTQGVVSIMLGLGEQLKV
jgi:hypothetical protein